MKRSGPEAGEPYMDCSALDGDSGFSVRNGHGIFTVGTFGIVFDTRESEQGGVFQRENTAVDVGDLIQRAQGLCAVVKLPAGL